ncbi:MAG: transglycosylase SLT domain-containing protein [Vulcanimicrobiaceae bacterium]
MIALAASAYLFLHQCAPSVSPRLMASIIQQESSWSPYAIRDDTTGKAYYPRDRAIAARLASTLYAQGHTIDVGYAGIDSIHFGGPANAQPAIDRALTPCANVAWGVTILRADYEGSRQTDLTLRWLDALRNYNGAGPSSADYARVVFQRALSTALPTIATLALAAPDHPWPAGASFVPVTGTGMPPSILPSLTTHLYAAQKNRRLRAIIAQHARLAAAAAAAASLKKPRNP